MPPLNAADLEDLDNLDPDDFDEGMDTAENRGDTIDPNAEEDDETDSTTDDGETSAESEEDDADTESGEDDDEAEGGESGGDDEADADDEAEVDDDADDAAGADDDDDDDDDEAGADDDDAAKADADEVDDGSDPRIPKSRFDSVNARRKDAERKLAELQAQVDRTGETGKRADRLTEIQQELGSLDDEINDAILDADAAKLKELRTRERELSNEALQFQLQNATSQAAAEARYDALLDKVEADYPEYNPDNEELYNEEMVTETLRLQKALMTSGSSKGDALLEAIDLIRPRYVEPGVQKKTSLRDKPKRDTKTNTKRNKKVAKAQPAATASRSSSLESAEDIDYDNLTQPEDLDKFDEKTLARMSGDVLE